jgi:hypothetical protein
MVAATLYAPKGPRQFQGVFDVIPFTFALDSTSLADGAGVAISVTGVTGAALGDFVDVSSAVTLDGMILKASVDAANTVEVVVQNESGSAADTGATTGYGIVYKRKANLWQL